MDELRANFEAAGQGHAFRWWNELGERGKRRLIRQLAAVDLSRITEMQAAMAALKSPHLRNLSPAPAFELADESFPYLLNDAARAMAPQGEKELRDGRVGVLLVAGGQGTRLGFDGPKGCYEILPLTGMTLFEVFARKLIRVGREYGKTPPLYVMVGNHNEAATRNFWEDRDYFGLNGDDVKFFAQGEMPALDDDGKLVMAAKDAIFTGPDGHGGVLQALHTKGMLDDMRQRGVRTISYLQVDNLQTPVADAAFIGLHMSEGAEVSLKVIRKNEPGERVGIYCLDDGVPGIVEYSEFSEAQANERDDRGRLKYWQGSIAVHLFGVDFLMRLVQKGTDLPLHAAHKKVPYIDAEGVEHQPEEPNAFKFERFVFDTIPMASNVMCLEVPRVEQFLPLKNADGPHGPDGVRQSYQDFFGTAVEAVLGKKPPQIEVDPAIAENARELIEYLKANDDAKSWDLNKPLQIKA
ncbi:MAG: UDPGP type 1 family protein [Planctomycetes bacterium]|nr:UDPGP type 1 family protein [Planctomycetota bacterium]